MWPRVIGGVVLGLIGLLWIAQGLGAAKGSAMTGHPSTPCSAWWWRGWAPGSSGPASVGAGPSAGPHDLTSAEPAHRAGTRTVGPVSGPCFVTLIRLG